MTWYAETPLFSFSSFSPLPSFLLSHPSLSLSLPPSISPSYTTPVIYPFYRDGTKQILSTLYYKYLELIEHDGHKPYGWPVSFQRSAVRQEEEGE